MIYTKDAPATKLHNYFKMASARWLEFSLSFFSPSFYHSFVFHSLWLRFSYLIYFFAFRFISFLSLVLPLSVMWIFLCERTHCKGIMTRFKPKVNWNMCVNFQFLWSFFKRKPWWKFTRDITFVLQQNKRKGKLFLFYAISISHELLLSDWLLTTHDPWSKIIWNMMKMDFVVFILFAM